MSDTTARRMRRMFVINGMQILDPDSNKSPEEVRKHLAANGYPTVTNAAITGPEIKDGVQTYTFKAAVATKG